MKNKSLITANILGIALVLGSYFLFRNVFTSFLNALGSAEIQTGTPSVGIIGGAAGPTALLVSSPHSPLFQWILLLPLVVAIGIFILNIIYLNRNQKKEK